jgi:hypothetical protein
MKVLTIYDLKPMHVTDSSKAWNKVWNQTSANIRDWIIENVSSQVWNSLSKQIDVSL